MGGQQIQYIQGEGQQVLMEGQQIQYVQGDGEQVVMDGHPVEMAGQITYAAPEAVDGQQLVYAAPMVVAAPARHNVSHEIFAKLAAGVSLTPEEMAQLSGQPASAAALPGSLHSAVLPGSPHAAAAPVGVNDGHAAASPGSTKASGKTEKKEKSGSKKALKASKKKKEKGCC